MTTTRNTRDALERIQRHSIGIVVMLNRIAEHLGVEPLTEKEIDGALVQRRQEAEARIAAGEPPRRLSDMARRRAYVS